MSCDNCRGYDTELEEERELVSRRISGADGLRVIAERERDEARAALAKEQERADKEHARASALASRVGHIPSLQAALSKAEEENARLRREWNAEIKIRKAGDVAADFYKAALGRANDRIAELEAQLATK